MKVLLAHNFYRSCAPSGEDVVYRNERALLEEGGVEVFAYEKHNDHIDASSLRGRLATAKDCAWSRRTYQELSRLLERTRPDVAHFHNTFPQISPSAYDACQDHSVPVVQTLHNFRLICPGGLLMRDGHPCEDCVGDTLLPSLVHRCYRGSLPATAAVTWMLARNRRAGAYRHQVNRYVALTDFAAGKLAAGGLPRERIVVKPNFLAEAPACGKGGGGYVAYVGRLGREKGLLTLLEAWRELPDVPLRIVGDGPLGEALRDMAREAGMPVEFLGHRSRREVLAILAQADLMVLPSECYEGFPMTLLEAFASGTPVLVSRLGGLDEIVADGETGVKFTPGDARDLAINARRLWTDGPRRAALGKRARETFETKYSGRANFVRLMEIYGQAMSEVSGGGGQDHATYQSRRGAVGRGNRQQAAE